MYEVRGPPALPAPAAIVIEALGSLVTEARRARIEAVVDRRTFGVVPVLEEITDPHNASAVLRSADAFGVQRVHVIEGPHGFKAARAVSKGTDRWLDVVRHASAEACVRRLHAAGYQVSVATMGGTLSPSDLASLDRVALVLGNEHRGPSPAMRELANSTCAIPMAGFVESLNVSVAAAVLLFGATAGRGGDLTDDERQELVARYLMASVRDAERAVAQHMAAR